MCYGWVGWVEEEKAVGMSYCELGLGGWVEEKGVLEWVGGWVERGTFILFGSLQALGGGLDFFLLVFALFGRGGWVG